MTCTPIFLLYLTFTYPVVLLNKASEVHIEVEISPSEVDLYTSLTSRRFRSEGQSPSEHVRMNSVTIVQRSLETAVRLGRLLRFAEDTVLF